MINQIWSDFFEYLSMNVIYKGDTNFIENKIWWLSNYFDLRQENFD